MANENYRSRAHLLLLYPDNENHLSVLEKIQHTYDYAAIKHDKDYFTEDVFYTAADEEKNPEHKEGTLKHKKGDLKKEHFHVIIRPSPKNATWMTAVAKKLGLDDTRFIEAVNNLENSLQYLIHFNDSNKAEYSVDEVFGPMKIILVESLNKLQKSEGEKVVDLLEYIQEHRGRLTITQFAHFCAKNGYWSEFRRSGAIFCKIIDEHNDTTRDPRREEVQ